ncbi:preprotein translocase subunit SecG [Patescibacteria group bacterium]|nr:MAG: preprotein translocase subunit SecG [Patescibacteria group bacterium]
MIATILLQQRGSSLGAGFGGGDTALYQTKRGAEKVFYYSTIFLAVIFVVSVVLSILAKR